MFFSEGVKFDSKVATTKRAVFLKEEKLERQKKGGLENFENLPIKKGLILRTSQFFVPQNSSYKV